MSIDWNELTEGYNRIYNTSFESDVEMFTILLKDLSPKKIANILGVSTIYRRLDFLGIERSHKRGGANNINGKKEAMFLAISEECMAKMAIEEITKESESTSSYCYFLTKKHNRSHKMHRIRRKKMKVTEVKAKIERIEELTKEGFNTPRLHYIEPTIFTKKAEERIFKCLGWAAGILKKNPKQIFNIRTYEYSERTLEETKKSEHITDIKFENLERKLRPLLGTKYCMVDAETPDNGIIAGNVIIHQNETAKAIKTFIMEFCIKPVRAMVREHDKSISGNLEDGANILYEMYEKILKSETSVKQVSEFIKDVDSNYIIPSTLASILFEANRFPKKDVILEWTIFNQPAGIFFDKKDIPLLPRMTVWWEWRRY